MKKLIFIILTLLAVNVSAQLTPVPDYRIQDNTTQLGVPIPVGAKVFVNSISTYYVAKAPVGSTQTITTAISSFETLEIGTDTLVTIDTINIFTYDTTYSYTYDTTYSYTYDTVYNYTYDTVTYYDTTYSYTYDTMYSYTYDTVTYYNYDTTYSYNFDTIYSYDTVTLVSTWGSINGTITDQTDLISYLSANYTNFTNADETDQVWVSDSVDYASKFYVQNLPISTFSNDAGYINSVAGDWTGTFDGQEGTYYLNRTNHTGTQTASTISDFDTEVSNNTDVAANTSARHSAVTVSGAYDYITLSGQDIIRGQVDYTTDISNTPTIPDETEVINTPSTATSYTEQWSEGDIISLPTLTGNTTLNIQNIPEGKTSQIRVTQNASTAYTLTLNLYSDSGSTLLTKITYGTNTAIDATLSNVTKIIHQRFGTSADVSYIYQN